MTAIDPKKIRELVLRMRQQSAELQRINAHDPSYCLGWRGATNTFSVELLSLLPADEQLDAAIADVVITIPLQNVQSIEAISIEADGGNPVQVSAACIDCGVPCDITRDPLRCLPCQLDAEQWQRDAPKGVVRRPYPICEHSGCTQEAKADDGCGRMLCVEHHNAEVAAAWEKANAHSARLSFQPTPGGMLITAKKGPQP